MTKKEILEMTGLSEEEFYRQYPTEESWTESYKKGGWIQKATASIKRRGTEGVCTGSKFGGPTCRPGTKRYNLAKTFRKMAKSRKEEGGYVDMYEEGGKIPDNVLRSRLESHMSPAEAQDYIDSYGEGGYTVKRSSDRKGKTHVVIGPDGTKKYFGDPNMGQREDSEHGKEAFYARHAKNLKNNPYFRAYARATWEDGGMVNPYGDGGQLPVDLLEARMKASGASQNEINAYKAQHYGQGGMVDVYQLMGMPTPDMYAMGGDVMMEDYARGGMIKRKDGSYSRRGLWDNIRANRGSGKKPTKEMLKQERKIRAAEKKEYGGMVNMYEGGDTVAESSSTAGAQAQARFMYDKAMQMPNRGMIYATPDAVNPNDYALATMSGYTGSNPNMVKQAADRTKKQVAPMAAGIAGAPLLSSSMATVGNLLARPFINTPGLSWLNANKVLDAHMLHAFADRAPEWTAAFEKAYASGSEKDLKELAKITTLQAIDISPVLEIGHLKNAPAAMKRIVDTLSPFAKTSKLVTEGKGSAKVVEHGLKEGTKHQADTTKKKAMGGPVMYKTGGETSGPFEETDLGASSMQGMSIGQVKNALKNNSEQTQRNVLKYDLNYINSLKNVLTPEEKFNLGLAYNRKLGNWDIGATGKVDYNRTINPESKSSVIKRDVNLGVTGGYQGPGGTSLSGEVNYNPITKTWGGSAKGSIAFKEGGPVMYGMGGTTNIGDLSHVISAKNFPNMGYAMGGSIPMYGFGSIVKDIGAGLYGAGEGMLDTLSMGATDALTDKGYETLQNLGGSSEAEKRQQDSIRGYGTTAGAITMGILNPFTASSAVRTGAKGLGQGISKGSPDSQLAQSMGTLLPMAGNAAGMVGGQMSVPSVPQAAMGGPVNYPEGYQKNITFARGGMTGPLTEINVEKGELLTDKDGKIVTKYRGGGMVPHPEEGMDERGTVPAQEGMFVITKAQAKNYEKAMNNSDKLYADAIRNNISYDKAKKEAAEEQAAMTAMDKFVAKYGGAVRRMYAKGGMVPMYDEGSTVLNTSAPSNWSWGNPQPVLPLENPGVYASLPEFMGTSTIPGSSFGSTPTNPFDISLPLQPMQPRAIDPSSVMTARPTASPQGVYTGPGSPYYNPGGSRMPAQTFDASNITGFDPGQYPNRVPYRIEAGESWPSTAASKTAGSPGAGGDMSNFGKYAPYVMQGLPIAWNLMQSMKKPTKVPGTLGAMSTALEAPKMSGEAGRRALAREGAAARYAWRQAGAQAGPAALTALTNTRMGRIADFEEGLRNAQAQMDYQAAAQRKAYEQFNAQQAMNRYMLQAQADAVPTQYASAGMGQLGQMGESILNRQALNQLYPKG